MNFKVSQHLAKLQAKKLIVSGTVLLEDEELVSYLEYGKKQLMLMFYVDFDFPYIIKLV